MKKAHKLIYGIIIYGIILYSIPSCVTTDLEKNNTLKVTSDNDKAAANEPLGVVVEEEAPPEQVTIVVEKPVFVPSPVEKDTSLSGKAAVAESLKEVTQKPVYEDGRLQSYHYHPDYIYEVHCQTYHIVDIELAAGDEVLETPFLSEPDIWQISAGESVAASGEKVPHFFLKPDYASQDSSMVVITNRHVYRLELKSFKDYGMRYVRWTYPLEARGKAGLEEIGKRIEAQKTKQEAEKAKYDFLSFDYKITRGIFTKVSWLPVQVYDDGSRTYIVLDEDALHHELPALFNEKNEIVNYRVDKNTLVADCLINKMTLKLGKKKVTITKKKK